MEPARFAVVEQGTEGPLVVFLHGVLDRGRSFQRVARELDGECRMVWYDRRGYGAAVDAPGAPVTFEGHADDVLDLLDGRSAILVGHSFGGITVLAAALRAPEQIRAAVLYETGLAWLPSFDDRVLGELLSRDDAAAAAVQMMFRDRYGRMSDDERAAWLREGPAFVVEERSVRRGGPPFDLAELRAPLVYGRGDAYHFAAVTDDLQQLVPNADIVVVPGAGHNAHRSHPGEFADLVRLGMRRAAG